jgi:hypothetical protein
MGEVIQLFPNVAKKKENEVLEEAKPMNNKIVFVRDENGNFVRKAVVKTLDILTHVAEVYAQLFHGFLTIGIKIGLFILLFPSMYKFFLIFIESVQKATE